MLKLTAQRATLRLCYVLWTKNWTALLYQQKSATPCRQRSLSGNQWLIFAACCFFSLLSQFAFNKKRDNINHLFDHTPYNRSPPLPLVNIWQMIVWICGTYVVNQSMPGSLSKELAIHSPLLVSQQKNMFNQVEIVKGMEGPSQSFPLA